MNSSKKLHQPSDAITYFDDFFKEKSFGFSEKQIKLIKKILLHSYTY
ncbi:MAG: hypothetical protein JW703_03965 [Candidatus Diapherotrites archaeon]|nr:hypothetical protein [Candidatus Diapherotrites archaeon]